MQRIVYACAASLIMGCEVAHARTSCTAHLFVSLTDRETNGPITNAAVIVRRQTQFNIGYTLDSFFTETRSMPDSNGIAHVEFQVYDGKFDWRVDAPFHYNGRFGSGYGHEVLPCVVEESDYLNINTNTVQGLAMYNELVQLDCNHDYLGFAARFSPKSVTYTSNVVCRSVCLTPKHNPLPMYAYSAAVDLPKDTLTVDVTNGVEVLHYKPVDFDIKEGMLVSQKRHHDDFIDGPAGKVTDFHIERFCMKSNGVESTFGWIEFAAGGGAYKHGTTGDPSFPTTYEADPTETFITRIPFRYNSITGQVDHVERILDDNEYLVLKTRVVTNDHGEVTSCNYSKILGPMTVGEILAFKSAIFNPRPNDTNLEFDTVNNYYTRNPCNWYP